MHSPQIWYWVTYRLEYPIPTTTTCPGLSHSSPLLVVRWIPACLPPLTRTSITSLPSYSWCLLNWPPPPTTLPLYKPPSGQPILLTQIGTLTNKRAIQGTITFFFSKGTREESKWNRSVDSRVNFFLPSGENEYCNQNDCWKIRLTWYCNSHRPGHWGAWKIRYRSLPRIGESSREHEIYGLVVYPG